MRADSRITPTTWEFVGAIRSYIFGGLRLSVRKASTLYSAMPQAIRFGSGRDVIFPQVPKTSILFQRFALGFPVGITSSLSDAEPVIPVTP